MGSEERNQLNPIMVSANLYSRDVFFHSKCVSNLVPELTDQGKNQPHNSILDQNIRGYDTDISAKGRDKESQRFSWGGLVEDVGLESLLEGWVG